VPQGDDLQAVAAQALHQHPVVGDDTEQPDAGLAGPDRCPLRGVGRGQRRLGEGEVGGAVVVDDEQPVAGHLHVVLDVLAPGGNRAQGGCGVGGVQQPRLGAALAGCAELHPAMVAGGVDPEPEPLVGLGVQQFVLTGVAEAVAPEPVGAPRVVDGEVAEGLVARPAAAGGHLGDLVRKGLAGDEVEEPEVVALVAAGVHGVGGQAAVGGDVEAAEGEEGLARCQRLGVEQQLLAIGCALGRVGQRVAALCGTAVVAGVVEALGGARVVPVLAETRVADELGHAQVGLLGAGRDVGVDLLPQFCQGSRDRFGVGVLRRQVSQELRIGLVPHPPVRVGEGVPVVGTGGGTAGGRRRLVGCGHAAQPRAGPGLGVCRGRGTMDSAKY